MFIVLVLIIIVLHKRITQNMSKTEHSKTILIRVILWGTIYFSGLALIYYVRWFIPFLMNKTANVVPPDMIPVLWFIIQICSNLIFLIVGFLFLGIFRRYRKTGFFDTGSINAFNIVIICCVGLAIMGAIQTIANNFYEVHLNEWTSFESIANLLFRSFTRLLVFREPQTMYFLMALILWSVKQFVAKALVIKAENESFV